MAGWIEGLREEIRRPGPDHRTVSKGLMADGTDISQRSLGLLYEAGQRRSKDRSQDTGPGALMVLQGEGRGVKEGGVSSRGWPKPLSSWDLCSRGAAR